MKKWILIVILLLIIPIFIVAKYNSFKAEYKQTKIKNNQYESYYQKELTGMDVATIVNRVIDENEINRIKKDSNGNYIENESTSIKVEIKITDNNKVYTMETLYNGGMANFVDYYGNIEFECTKIEYHPKTQKVKYMLFEQRSE